MEHRDEVKKRRRFKARGGVQKEKKHDRSKSTEDGRKRRNRRRYDEPRSFCQQNTLKTLIVTGEESTTLDRDLYSYLVRVQNEMQSLSAQSAQDNNDDDELPPSVLLAQNAVSEIIPRLHEVSMDPSGSRILQSLLRRIRNPEIIADAMGNIVSLGPSRFVSFAEHRCASYVLQDIIILLSSFSALLVPVRDSVLALARVLESWDFQQLLNVIEVPCGSHVLRSVFGLLTGIPPEEPRTAKLDDSSPVPIRPYYEVGRVETPKEWHGAIAHFANLIISAPSDKVQNLPWSTASCGALQGLISASTCIDRTLTKKLVKVVLGTQLSDLVFDSCGSRFVERAVTCLGAGIVWDEVKGHLTEMVAHPKANHVAQRVFLAASGRAQVKAVWDELEQQVTDCLCFGSAREGVVLAMIRAAEAEGDNVLQRRASKCIAKAMGTTGENSKYFVGAILTGSLQGWKKWQSEIISCSLSRLGIHGSNGDVLRSPTNLRPFNTVNMLVARSLLRFRGAAGQAARDSMNSITHKELLALLADSVGSRLLEQWVSLDVKNNEKVVLAVLSADPWSVVATAKCAYGAMVLSRCVLKVNQNLQVRVMDILASKIQELKEDRFGSVVIRKCRVELYAHNRVEWRNADSARATRARLFDDLFQSEN